MQYRWWGDNAEERKVSRPNEGSRSKHQTGTALFTSLKLFKLLFSGVAQQVFAALWQKVCLVNHICEKQNQRGALFHCTLSLRRGKWKELKERCWDPNSTMAVLNQTPCYEAWKAGGGEQAGTSRINRDEKEIQNGLKAETCYIVTWRTFDSRWFRTKQNYNT